VVFLLVFPSENKVTDPVKKHYQTDSCAYNQT
jgi:hypothetical protein